MLRGIAPEITEKNLDAMLGRLKARGIPVLLIGMLAAPNLGPDYQKAFDAIYPRLAQKYGVPLYPFFLDGVATVPGMQLKDAMHPDAAGVDTMVAGILPLVEAELDRIAGRD
jgi:acyl-CoA thioesterase-1